METICALFDLSPLPQTQAGEDESGSFATNQPDVLTV
jgi:hypothetical protein